MELFCSLCAHTSQCLYIEATIYQAFIAFNSLSFQAFIFWVVDNYLKKSIRHTTSRLRHINGLSPDDTTNGTAGSVLYSAPGGRYYKRCPAEDEESDVLLASHDDEVVNIHQSNTLALLVEARTAMQPKLSTSSIGSDMTTSGTQADTSDQKCLLID